MKTVGIMVHGTSIKELESRIEEFRDVDMFWVSMNFFWVTEQILEKINKKLDMVICIDPDPLRRFESKYYEFSKRGEFINRKHFKDYPGNTLFCLLCFLMDRGVEKIILFGADGYSDDSNVYYKQDQYEGGIPGGRNNELKQNCEQFNNDFPLNTKNTKIYNCSLKSHYEVFDKISYDDCLSLLKGGKNG